MYIGRVNGLASTAASCARIVAPIFGTSLFTWSANFGLFYPFNYTLVYNVAAFLAFGSLVLTYFVPLELNRARTKK